MPPRFAFVCLAGAFGTGARYLLGTWAVRTFGPVFPVGTLIINALGSFLLVVIMGLSLERGLIPADLRIVLTTGVMGGFTTYSTFNYETLRLFQQGSRGLGLLYLGGTLVVCLVLGVLGAMLVRLVPAG
ncbi:MAG TPA: CrcB family protein [Polyangia bacterium]|nr:CrcB family protein [Polyangia bacterium]